MTTQNITIPAREVRPGDVLFGMTVAVSSGDRALERHYIRTRDDVMIYLSREMQVTVERPLPSSTDPIGTVRVHIVGGIVTDVYLKNTTNQWFRDAADTPYSDATVADFRVLWMPGMPFPDAQAHA